MIRENSFPFDPKTALKNGFAEAERKFIEIAKINGAENIDRSGSCAIVILIVGNKFS